ncbi:hypothetical protein SAMN02745165_03348 [Malonomonas rubra DSM 5091]|uniref:Uncharacterized protein n=1 Tax=Malonomonas rubra DSM 5091 TaxID=1122189 RepID=A0A1M6MPV3_MALRU|nr:hypothetical protein [Malonomonas rubra]SHJ85323.1 hypothetical protein SAMN02745165_03348 [Malonomonas rubra DSM 5091]
MKTRLAILIAGLIFLATPMLAMAHGGDRYDDGPRHHNSWVKDKYKGDYHRYEHRPGVKWRQHQIKKEVRKQVKRELRHERKERKARRHYVQHHRDQRRHVDTKAAILVGLPHLVFHIDW